MGREPGSNSPAQEVKLRQRRPENNSRVPAKANWLPSMPGPGWWQWAPSTQLSAQTASSVCSELCWGSESPFPAQLKLPDKHPGTGAGDNTAQAGASALISRAGGPPQGSSSVPEPPSPSLGSDSQLNQPWSSHLTEDRGCMRGGGQEISSVCTDAIPCSAPHGEMPVLVNSLIFLEFLFPPKLCFHPPPCPAWLPLPICLLSSPALWISSDTALSGCLYVGYTPATHRATPRVRKGFGRSGKCSSGWCCPVPAPLK